MNNMRVLLLACGGLIGAAVPYAWCHPHVFIENSFTFVFSEGRLEGLSVTWVFDEMFSASIIMENDRNRNGAFEEKEIRAVERGAFANLRNFNYFLFLDSGGSRMKIKAVRDFRAEILGRKLVYHFFVPLNIAVRAGSTVFRAGCFDNTYFCDVSYAKDDPVTVETDAQTVVSWELVKDKKNAYWGGTIVPRVVHLQFRLTDE
jgi:ABC-type uncharacterized transport system substrate-binding protein